MKTVLTIIVSALFLCPAVCAQTSPRTPCRKPHRLTSSKNGMETRLRTLSAMIASHSHFCVPQAAAWLLLFSAAGAAQEPDRYAPRDPLSLTVPRQTVTRRDYVEFLRPFARDFQAPPADAWAPGHGPLNLMPPLAVFALDGDPELGQRVKAGLRSFAQWVDQCAATKGALLSLDAATISVLCAQELRGRGVLTAEDEVWIRDLLLKIRRFHCGWTDQGPWDGWWRGSHHRAQAQGINNALAAFLYPEDPAATEWRNISDTIWGDWWDFRDVGINDMWYFHSSFGNITRAAHILGRKEVFTDPQSRQLFERILFETTPEGTEVGYGCSIGYNALSGSRVVALELAARYTGDGRYRWVAHRLMNNYRARDFGRRSAAGSKAHADIAMASLICDDSIVPIQPEPDSKLLTRKEITRNAVSFPGFGGVDCNMYMTQRVLPNKLAFRSGWEPGDLFMLVECYVRHDPLNPTAILGLERYGASSVEMVSEKSVSRENAVAIHDVSGTARFLGQQAHQGAKALPEGWAGMECEVPVFADGKLATHARVEVTHYMGFEATQRREFLFIKNGFILMRDETTFHEPFRAEVGPVWNTQHVGDVRGPTWINTWFSAHYFGGQKLYDVPPWDLLVWYAPREGARLRVVPEQADKVQAESRVFPTRYSWEGEVAAGTSQQFVTVLLPHSPTRDASPLAAGIVALADRPGVAAVQVTQGTRREVAILNAAGATLDLKCEGGTPVFTDAHAAYLDFDGRRLRRAQLLQGTFLKLEAETVFQQVDLGDWETE